MVLVLEQLENRGCSHSTKPWLPYILIPHLHLQLWSFPWPSPSVRLFRLPSSQPPPQSCKWCGVGDRSECGRCHCQQVGWHWWSHLGWSGTQWRSSTWGSRLTRWHSKWWLSCLPRSSWRGSLQELQNDYHMNVRIYHHAVTASTTHAAWPTLPAVPCTNLYKYTYSQLPFMCEYVMVATIITEPLLDVKGSRPHPDLQRLLVSSDLWSLP